jgi:class 3 adenylate cyclase
MTVYITKKQSWIRFLASFLPGAGITVLLCWFLAGPRLGFFYDFLLRRRPPLPVSGELLIIDTVNPGSGFSGLDAPEDILEPSAAASVLLTMTELRASTLILQAPVLGLSAGGSAGEEEIRYRFDEEFGLLGRNIRNLFDAIRTGSVAPGDSARYVGELIGLSELGKERLVAALVRRDEEGMLRLEKAARTFGGLRRPGDLLVQVIRTGEDGRPGALASREEYSRVQPDKDGALRRIPPVRSPFGSVIGDADGLVQEHIIYGALKSRYQSSEIEPAGNSAALRNLGGPGGVDRIIPLDKNGAVLFEVPHKGEDFRRIGLKDFLDYDEADRTLRRLLGEAESLGVYSGLEGEKHPGYLYDYALALREDMLAAETPDPQGPETAGEDRKIAWIEARDAYFKSLEDFLYGSSEMNLVGGYEEIIASESLGEEGIGQVILLRDSLIRTFVGLREKYNEVLDLRTSLEAALAGSFCILGPSRTGAAGASDTRDAPLSLPNLLRIFRSGAPGLAGGISGAEASALLANSLLTGRVITPGRDLWLLLGGIACAFLASLLLRPMGVALSLIMGALFTFLSGAAFSWSFILSGIWLDPLVPGAASAAAALVSFIWVLFLKDRFGRQFRLCYGPAISRSSLRRVVREGKPRPAEAVTVRAAVVAVRNPGLMVQEDRVNPRSGAEASLTFREKVAESFRQAGGTVVGSEGDLVLACFGSPLERIALGGRRASSPYADNVHARYAPAIRAAGFVTELLSREESRLWFYAIDTGECTFTWSPLSGYSAFGRPVVRTRILSSLVSRYRARVLVTAQVNDALPDLPARKLDVLKERDGTGGEAFYELRVNV